MHRLAHAALLRSVGLVGLLAAAALTTVALTSSPPDSTDPPASPLVTLIEARLESASERLPGPGLANVVWDRLADCESGDWNADGEPIPGSRDWRHDDRFEGGLNFHPDTWESYRGEAMPASAARATRSEEIRVARQVLDAQGWKAWPVCSRKLGLR